MPIKNIASQLALAMAIYGPVMGQQVEGPEYNNPNGTPGKFFAASGSIPVAAIQEAAAKASVVPDQATYPVAQGSSVMSTIHSDWAQFSSGAAYSFIADMDVDCDGLNHDCKGNPDGQAQTNWGALSAYEVPFIVIPNSFQAANSAAIPGNNVVAVICGGRMYYGIFGDTNGNDPQVTGEASWVLARTCFPGEDLAGDKGHNAADVTYIVFTGSDAVLPGSALNANYITNFDTLRSTGDKLVTALASNLGAAGSGGNGGGADKPPTSSGPHQSSGFRTTSTPQPTGGNGGNGGNSGNDGNGGGEGSWGDEEERSSGEW
ncbi:hypothetical protein BBP40_002342 [Aspergillus hancockii]|nr:hypothetical protein BBP40_002342 [Aspergillus hancockii]